MGLNSTETWKQKLFFEPQKSQGFGCYGRSFAQALYMWTMFLGKSTHHLQYRDVINKFNKISVACSDLTFKSTSKFSPSMLFLSPSRPKRHFSVCWTASIGVSFFFFLSEFQYASSKT